MYSTFFFVIRGRDELKTALSSCPHEVVEELCQTQIWKIGTSSRGLGESHLLAMATHDVKAAFTKFYWNDYGLSHISEDDPLFVLRQVLAPSKSESTFDAWWEIVAVTRELVDADTIGKELGSV
jgi:hypothetical protein